jgi:DNA-binding SARP family transcriptional activator
MALVTIRLLGPFAAIGPSGDISSIPKKAQAMLAMIALSPTYACPRSVLVGRLWSDRDDEHGARAGVRW